MKFISTTLVIEYFGNDIIFRTLDYNVT